MPLDSENLSLPPISRWNVDIDVYLDRFVPRNVVRYLPYPVAHFLGHRTGAPKPLGNVPVAFWSMLGAFVGVISLEAVFMIPEIRHHGPPLVIASFGAGAILEYNTIESPLAQPRNSLIGHAIATAVAIAITKAFELNSNFQNLRWLAGGLACGVASAAMTLTKTIYPPAGATALLAAIDPTVNHLGWYLLPLVILSSTLTLAISLVINNVQRRFPTYWWTPADLTPAKDLPPADDESEGKEDDTLKDSTAPSPANEKVAPSTRVLSTAPTLADQQCDPPPNERLASGAINRNPSTVSRERPSTAQKMLLSHNLEAVIITADEIITPEGMALAFEEDNILQILRNRLAQGAEGKTAAQAHTSV